MVEGIGSTPNLNLGIIQWCPSGFMRTHKTVWATPAVRKWNLTCRNVPVRNVGADPRNCCCKAPEDDSIERCHPEKVRTDICADKHGGCVGCLVRKLRKAVGNHRQKYGRTCSQCTSNCKWKYAVDPDLEHRHTGLTSCMTSAPSRSWTESNPQNRTLLCLFGRATANCFFLQPLLNESLSSTARQPLRAQVSLLSRFRGHTQHTTVGRNPLDQWSARCRDLYLTTQHTQETDILAPSRIRTRNPSKRAAADPRFTPRGNLARLIIIIIIIITRLLFVLYAIAAQHTVPTFACFLNLRYIKLNSTS